MEIHENLIKNRFWTFFLPALLFILTAISIQGYFGWKNSPEKIQKKFQHTLKEKEQLLETYMGILKKNYPQHRKNFNGSLTENEKGNLDQAGLSLFIYEKDSLKWWSTNTIPLPYLIHPDPHQTFPCIQESKNGWYLVTRNYNGLNIIEGRILIRYAFPFENEYLQNDYQEDFMVPEGTKITLNRNDYPIVSQQGKYLFSLKIPADPPLTRSPFIILLVLYVLALILFIASLYRLLLLIPRLTKNRWLFLLVFFFILVGVRFVQVYFQIPKVLYNTELFGPTSFSSSFFFPSLGDFLINSLIFLVFAYVFYLSFSGETRRITGPGKYGYMVLIICALVICLIIAVHLVKDLVVNSTIPFTLQNVSNLDFNSFLGFIIISSVFLSLFLIGSRLINWMIILSGITTLPFSINIRFWKFSVSNILVYLVFFSVFATVILNHYNEKIEKDKRKLLAIKLGATRDPLAEMMFARFEPTLLNDSILKGLILQNRNTDSITRYLQDKYFKDYWNNFSIQFTLCHGDKQLRVQPQNYLVNCDSYFRTLIREMGKPTFSKQFYYLDYGYGFKNYLAVLPVSSPSSDTTYTYIEISSKLVFKDLGYPELLVDKRQVQVPDLSEYSYAFYRNKKLVNRMGTYQYSMELDHTVDKHPGLAHFYSKEGMNHYCFPIDKTNNLIISKQDSTLLDRIAPFSYLFLFFALYTLLFITLTRFHVIFRNSWFSLSTRLQLAMSGVLITSFLIIGILMVYYIIRLNSDKNLENLSDRAHSMLVELQHKIGTLDDIHTESPSNLEQMLTKFSNVYFSDVNMYDVDGKLIATSRPEIFETGLVSTMMNSTAYSNMKSKHLSYYNLKETIGSHSYNSAYMPFYNDQNKLLAYLNLPYFTRQEDLKSEISTFLIAFINIYVFLIIIGLMLSLVVSKYIIRPLSLLTGNIEKLGFGRKNEKLEWSRNDEVGKLVDEYNRMVQELEKSAGLLAQSERESAWREMARQVAHEIKNPLTPMKLSVQHLQRAWKDKAPDWEDRLRRFTETMTEQIETLSQIASEFSDFAKMPAKNDEKLDIEEVIEKTLTLYQDIPSIRFVFTKSSFPRYILADRKQMLRVFTNLINNAVYAIGEKTDGMITFSAVDEKDSVLITVSDNGSGISREQAGRIFQPNFTTKTSGMGLGLAIVRSIVQGAGGEILFHSEEGKGTTFMIRFPLLEKNKS